MSSVEKKNAKVREKEDIIEYHPPNSLKELFFGFLYLGLIGFGGVLPITRSFLVEQRRWVNSQHFDELLGVCQFLPGGNVSNLVVAVGREFFGFKGAMAALLGLITGPIIFVVLLSIIYSRFQNHPVVQHVLSGIAAAACGLLIAMVLKMMRPFWRSGLTIFVIVVSVILLNVFYLSIVKALLILFPLSIFLCWKWKQS